MIKYTNICITHIRSRGCFTLCGLHHLNTKHIFYLRSIKYFSTKIPKNTDYISLWQDIPFKSFLPEFDKFIKMVDPFDAEDSYKLSHVIMTNSKWEGNSYRRNKELGWVWGKRNDFVKDSILDRGPLIGIVCSVGAGVPNYWEKKINILIGSLQK